ncbi:Serine/threonine-protein kinase SIK1 [Lemmus lemmus]
MAWGGASSSGASGRAGQGLELQRVRAGGAGPRAPARPGRRGGTSSSGASGQAVGNSSSGASGRAGRNLELRRFWAGGAGPRAPARPGGRAPSAFVIPRGYQLQRRVLASFRPPSSLLDTAICKEARPGPRLEEEQDVQEPLPGSTGWGHTLAEVSTHFSPLNPPCIIVPSSDTKSPSEGTSSDSCLPFSASEGPAGSAVAWPSQGCESPALQSDWPRLSRAPIRLPLCYRLRQVWAQLSYFLSASKRDEGRYLLKG